MSKKREDVTEEINNLPDDGFFSSYEGEGFFTDIDFSENEQKQPPKTASAEIKKADKAKEALLSRHDRPKSKTGNVLNTSAPSAAARRGRGIQGGLLFMLLVSVAGFMAFNYVVSQKTSEDDEAFFKNPPVYSEVKIEPLFRSFAI